MTRKEERERTGGMAGGSDSHNSCCSPQPAGRPGPDFQLIGRLFFSHPDAKEREKNHWLALVSGQRIRQVLLERVR